MSEESKVIVDDFFWLRRAAKVVEDSSEKLDQGAQRIAAAAGWFWTAYSGVAAVVAFTMKDDATTNVRVLLGIPVLTLFAAYALATWASLPLPVSFRVTAPLEIKRAHEAAIHKKRFRVALSLGFSAVTVVTVLAAASVATSAPRTSRTGVEWRVANRPRAVVVAGKLDVATQLGIRITPVGKPAKYEIVSARANEPFSVTVPVVEANGYHLEASWKENSRSVVLAETVEAL